jgi:hypothetical protein
MDVHKRLAKHLTQLNKAIRRLVAKSPEFEDLRKLLREGHVELAIYVVPIIDGKAPGDDLRFELTDDDRKFLKKAGIKF